MKLFFLLYNILIDEYTQEIRQIFFFYKRKYFLKKILVEVTITLLQWSYKLDEYSSLPRKENQLIFHPISYSVLLFEGLVPFSLFKPITSIMSQ